MRKEVQWIALGVSLTIAAAGTAAWVQSGHTDVTAGSTDDQPLQSSDERRRTPEIEIVPQRTEAWSKGLDLTETQTSAIAQPLALVETVYEQAISRGEAILAERAVAEREKLLKAASGLPAGAFDGEAER